MTEPRNHDTIRRVLLAAVAIPSVEIGLWATFSPRAFFDRFPGGGRHWVSVDGPYNEHLVRDVGALYLALALVTIVAIVTLQPAVVRVAAWANLVNAVPHLVYHLRHLSVYSSSDKVANAVSLSLAVVAPAVVLLLTRRGSRPEPAALEHRAQGPGSVGHDPVDAEVE
jgi:hypothetical protein